MEWTYSLEKISDAAAQVWKACRNKKVIAFHGGLGAGKTTFIHALCELLGVQENVSSPTFSLINEYSSPRGPVYHVDLYRLNSEEEAIRAGVEDCLFSGSVCLVEWPERAPGIFPDDTFHLYFSPLDESTRLIKTSA